MKNRILLVLLTVVACAMSVSAQELWTSVGAKQSFGKAWSIGADAEYRTHNGLKSSERVSIGVGGEFKQRYYKIDAGYKFIESHTLEEITKKGNIIPPYWIGRHRVYVSATGKYKFGRFELSLRERYQFTHRMGKSVPKFGADGETEKRDEWIMPKDKHVLRSRLGCDYNIKKSNFTPYVNVELYNVIGAGAGLEKVRYTAGSEYKINKKNRVELFYTFEQGVATGEKNYNVIGVGYLFKN